MRDWLIDHIEEYKGLEDRSDEGKVFHAGMVAAFEIVLKKLDRRDATIDLSAMQFESLIS